MTRPLRIGLVGLGTAAGFYLEALQRLPSLRLQAVCDVDAAALAPFAGRVPCHWDHRSLVARDDLDGVVIAVPNDAHVGVCRDAIQAGLAVCVEKPLATRLEDGTLLVSLARARGVPLFTAFHRRYNAAVQSLAERLPPGTQIESLTVNYLERIEDHMGADRWYLDPARCGGGCVADNGSSAFDLVRLFLGEVRLTDADIDRDAEGVDRRARITLASERGASATINLDWSFSGECKELEIRLADGTTLVADMLAGHSGYKASLHHEYVAVLEHFAAAIRSGGHVADGGLRALELVEAAYGSEGTPARV